MDFLQSHPHVREREKQITAFALSSAAVSSDGIVIATNRPKKVVVE